MNTFEHGSFDHIGIPSDEPRPGEVYVPETKVWVTSPRDNPANVEWVRFEDDSSVTGPLRHMPHLAYRTLDVEAAIEGHDVLLEPFVVADGFLKAAFVLVDGARSSSCSTATQTKPAGTADAPSDDALNRPCRSKVGGTFCPGGHLDDVGRNRVGSQLKFGWHLFCEIKQRLVIRPRLPG